MFYKYHCISLKKENYREMPQESKKLSRSIMEMENRPYPTFDINVFHNQCCCQFKNWRQDKNRKRLKNFRATTGNKHKSNYSQVTKLMSDLHSQPSSESSKSRQWKTSDNLLKISVIGLRGVERPVMEFLKNSFKLWSHSTK